MAEIPEDFPIFQMEPVLNASKSSEYRNRVLTANTALMAFLYREKVLYVNPLDENGQVSSKLVIRKRDLDRMGLELFKKAIPSWQRARDKDHNYSNVSSLEKALEKLRSA